MFSVTRTYQYDPSECKVSNETKTYSLAIPPAAIWFSLGCFAGVGIAVAMQAARLFGG